MEIDEIDLARYEAFRRESDVEWEQKREASKESERKFRRLRLNIIAPMSPGGCYKA
jgi:hypothetical protein